MLDQTIRSGTVSALQESLNLQPDDWHGFCLGFSTGHLGYALILRQLETAALDHEPIPTRQRTQPVIEDAFFRQINFDAERDELRFAFFHEGAEKEQALVRPKRLIYERIRSDAKELRVDLPDGSTALIQLYKVETPERLGVVNDKEPGC